jgi:accessory colonization factor AcfC
MSGKPRRKLTDKEKSRLDNNDIPNLTLRHAARAFKKGDPKEADRLWNMVKDSNKKEK